MGILRDIYALLIAVLTLLVGGFVFILLSVVGLIYTLVKHIFVKRDYAIKRQLLPIIRSFTLVFDGTANACAGELLNDVLGNSRINYGKWYQTISAVTGLRLVFDFIDNKFRKTLDRVLGNNHCEESITEEEMFYYKNIDKL